MIIEIGSAKNKNTNIRLIVYNENNSTINSKEIVWVFININNNKVKGIESLYKFKNWHYDTINQAGLNNYEVCLKKNLNL